MTSTPTARVEARSSRWWAIFHLNLTRWLFPERMIADDVGVSKSVIRRWFIPWERTDEHLPFSHVAEVTHTRGFFWDSITVESSGGLNPLVVTGLPKAQARYFVEHVRQQLNEAVVTPPPQARR